MLENQYDAILSPKDMLSQLRKSELRRLELEITDLSWLKDKPEYQDEDIINQVFIGNRGWAETFFEIRELLSLKVIEDPDDTNYAYLVTSDENTIITVLRLKKIKLRDQIQFEGEDLYLADSSLSNAINVKSLTPNFDKPCFFNMTAYLYSKDIEGGKSGFLFGNYEDRYTVSFDPITNADGLSALCHELGHFWAEFLKVVTPTKESRNVLDERYNFVKDLNLRGWNLAHGGILQTLTSERIANIIGKIIARKIDKTYRFPMVGEILSRARRNKQEERYEKAYLAPALQKFPELTEKIKKLFISRTSRVEL